jgi:hypothetical protein
MKGKRLLSIFGILVLAILGLTTTYSLNAKEGKQIKLSLNRGQQEGREPISTYNVISDKPLSKTVYLHEDFEGTTFPPSGWDTTNYNPGFGWFRGLAACGGSYCALVTWDSMPPATLQDEWLFTPGMDVSEANSLLRLEFIFFRDNVQWVHDLNVYISTIGGTNREDYTEIWRADTVAHESLKWWETTVDLSDYIGEPQIYIAFQYLGTDANLGGVDNVTVTDDPIPTGRCCYGDPYNPDCVDQITDSECTELGGYWVVDLNCIDNPCPIASSRVYPSDDMYTDPDTGPGHPHPIEEEELWTADFDVSGHHERIMMKFDVSPYVGKEIDSAVLSIYRFFRCPNHPYTNSDWYFIDCQWTEETWDEYTHISHEPTHFKTVVIGPELGWLHYDMTSAVNEWLIGKRYNYGFVIQAKSGEKWSQFYSKEAAEELRPYLEIYLPIVFTEPHGLRLVGGEDTLVWVDDQTITGETDKLYEGETGNTIEVFFVDEFGKLFQPAPVSFPVTCEVTNPDIVTSEMVGDCRFAMTGQTKGQTAFTINIWEDIQARYISPEIPFEVYRCGDANGDESINLGDVVYINNLVFHNGPAPGPYEAGDANNDDSVNLGDAVYLINYIFHSGPEPCAT